MTSGKHTFGLSVLLVLLVLTSSPTYAADTLYDQRFGRWTEQAQQGDAAAQYNLGNAYLRGNEVDRDVAKALAWLRKSAAQRDAKAEYKLGYLYYTGKGVRRNYTAAFKLLSKSAQRGYSPAQFYLGRLYAESRGVERDYRKALYWYQQAAADNYPSAKAEAAKIEVALAAEADERARQHARTITAKNSTHLQANTNPPPRPADAGQHVRDTKIRLLEGNWINADGAAAEHLPSSRNSCTAVKAAVVCETARLQRSSLSAQITYMVESEFRQFTPQGKFMVSYRTNVLFVLPEDPDNPEPNVEDIPSSGWTPKTIMKCRFTDDKHINCVNGTLKHEEFSRE